MPTILICAPDPLTEELFGTLIWREDNERHVANRSEDALTIAVAARPDLIVVDRDLPGALALIKDMRSGDYGRFGSIVVIARGEMDPEELHLLSAGGNAIVRLPAGPEWDERLARLMHVPVRQAVRVPVRLECQAWLPPEMTCVYGIVLNISTTGMLVEVSRELAIGDDLDFVVCLPGSDEPIRGAARVVRRARVDQFGLEFDVVEGDGRDRIARLV